MYRDSPGPKLQNITTNLVLLKKIKNKYKLETTSLIARASKSDTNTTVQFSVQWAVCYGLTPWATQHLECLLTSQVDWGENRNVKSENSWAEIKTILYVKQEPQAQAKQNIGKSSILEAFFL